MTRVRQVVLIVLALCGSVSDAGAGAKWSNTVYISGTSASGGLGSARASSDSNQYIGCETIVNYGYCYVQDASGTSRSCAFGSAMVPLVMTITESSYLYFSWDTSGNCNYLHVENASALLPLTP
jgi:hypothetical protein